MYNNKRRTKGNKGNITSCGYAGEWLVLWIGCADWLSPWSWSDACSCRIIILVVRGVINLGGGGVFLFFLFFAFISRYRLLFSVLPTSMFFLMMMMLCFNTLGGYCVRKYTFLLLRTNYYLSLRYEYSFNTSEENNAKVKLAFKKMLQKRKFNNLNRYHHHQP